MRGYETTVVVRPSTSEDQNTSLKAKVESIVKAEGGQLCSYEDWGNRKLAFTRKRENKGHYHYFSFTGQTSTVAEIERNLRINENVILFLSVHRTEGDSAEEVSSLKEATAMVKPKERPLRGAFNEGGAGGGRGGFRDRDEGFKGRE